jgi:hypothetical protein
MAAPKGKLVTPVAFDPTGKVLALEVDANGYLKVAQTTPANLTPGICAWDGAAWQKIPIGDTTVYASSNDRGIARINVIQTAATAATAYVWALRNATAGRTLYITKILLQLGFNGTGAATQMSYRFVKGITCTAMSGGTFTVPLLKRTSITNPDVDCRTLDTGLTLTGVSLGAPFWIVSWPRLTPSATQSGTHSPQFMLDFSDKPIELAQDCVLILQNAAASVIGDTIAGGCEFYG